MFIVQVERYCWSMRPGVLAGCAASTVTQNSFPWQQTAGCCCSRPSSEWLKHFHGHNRWSVNNNVKVEIRIFKERFRSLEAIVTILICNVNISARGKMWILHLLWIHREVKFHWSWGGAPPCCQQTIGRQTLEKCQYVTSPPHTPVTII